MLTMDPISLPIFTFHSLYLHLSFPSSPLPKGCYPSVVFSVIQFAVSIQHSFLSLSFKTNGHFFLHISSHSLRWLCRPPLPLPLLSLLSHTPPCPIAYPYIPYPPFPFTITLKYLLPTIHAHVLINVARTCHLRARTGPHLTFPSSPPVGIQIFHLLLRNFDYTSCL